MPADVHALAKAVRLATNAARDSVSYTPRDAMLQDMLNGYMTPKLDAGATPGDDPRRRIVLQVAQSCKVAVEAVNATLQSFQGASPVRDALLFSLCRLLDALVDAVPVSARNVEGISGKWRNELRAAVETLLGPAAFKVSSMSKASSTPVSAANADDPYAVSLVEYARQAVLHVAADRDGRVLDMLSYATQFVNGGVALVVAVASHDLPGVLATLGGLATSVKAAHSSKALPWYDVVRVLSDLSPERLITTVNGLVPVDADGDATQVCRHPPQVTFFVVELLDTVARTPLAPDAELSAANTLQEQAMDAMCELYRDQSPRFGVNGFVRRHTLQRLHRLCSLPVPRLQAVAKEATRLAFLYVRPPTGWRRIVPCVSASAQPLALALDTDVSSVAMVASVPADARFYIMHTVGVLDEPGKHRTAGVDLVAAALKAADPVEAAVEQLRLYDDTALNSTDLRQQQLLYVQPKSAPDTRSLVAEDLRGATMDWLHGSRPVLLLHGTSGSGKSMFVTLLSAELWRAYRRFSDSVVPIRIELSAATDPASTAVEEALHQRAGLSMTDLAADGRTALLVLDGFDEIHGTRNISALW